MPPQKRKIKFHCRCKSKAMCEDVGSASLSCRTNPHVVIAPLMCDVSSTKKYRFTGLPASATLYNKPELSDVLIKVGDDQYFAHSTLLSAASDVFATMFGADWMSISKTVPGVAPFELTLTEDAESVEVFDRFIYYIYSGNVVISESYVIPLFVLADKYNVRSLYDECAKVIETGLKVFIVHRTSSKSTVASSGGAPLETVGPGEANRWPNPYFSTSSSSSSDSTDSSSEDFEFEASVRRGTPRIPLASLATVSRSTSDVHSTATAGCTSGAGSGTTRTRLIPSETFSIALILRLLRYGHNDKIHCAALFNLEARVGNQISHGNHSAVWNELDADVVVKMLADSRFCYPEIVLFEAAKMWLNASVSRRTNNATVTEVLSQIRYPLLTTAELHRVIDDAFVRASPRLEALTDDAVRYQLFQPLCTRAEDRARWKGVQYEKRITQ